MGLTWLHYGRRRTSLALHKESTLDCQDKFRTRVGQCNGIRFPPLATLLHRRRLPFPPLGSCLHAKGDLLSIAPQELLLDLGPLTSWP